MKRFLCSTLVAAISLAAAQASAQDTSVSGFQAEQFEPMPAQGVNPLNLASSDVLGAWAPSAGLFFHYVDDPVEVVDENDEVIARLLGSQAKLELYAAIGLFDIFDLGLVMPLILAQSGEEIAAFDSIDASGFSPGDLRIVPKARILPRDLAGGLGIAIAGTIWLPTGDDVSLNSDGTVRGEPRLVVDWASGDWLVAANAGFQFRETTSFRNYTSGDTVRWGLGARVPFSDTGLRAIGSLFGAVGIEEGRDPADIAESAANDRARPVELDLGLEYALPFNLVANAGGGFGLTSGLGSPDYRIFASFGYTETVVDTDGDGLEDPVDSCPEEPEDSDGFEDSDGCPDPDNDADSILDTDDQCPDDPEDVDGFEDGDGCPDPDNDADDILDVDDECPDEPGVPEKDGCPYTDDDGDGLLDDVDQCPDQPEDADQFEDEDGCPDPDNDQDGILDVDDKCPLQPETINGNKDEDGCPDKGQSKVRVTKSKIEILEKVFFDTNKATIKQRSYNVLNQVASVLKAYPSITGLRVEGHTDSRGRDNYNLDLSERRADAVRQYLIAQGVDAARLSSIGFGEEFPIADNNTKQGREENRRVEFLITHVDGEPLEGKPAVIEKEVEE